MRRPRVYLCGPIAGLTTQECTEQRKDMADRLAHYGIEGWSPMRGKENIVAPGTPISSNAYEGVMASATGIIGRDRNDVFTCDAVLADLRGAKKASIGSMVEFGWADAWRKPIVTIMEPGNVHDHVFVKQLSTYVTDAEDEAIRLLSMLLTNLN
jgi:nucleoside 2-deoxyribosyltransferase